MPENVSEVVDILIAGGGISGLGVALEAARRGYSFLLMERDECGKATSDSSLRIIHGGFRYLQHLDLPRVVESCRDQQVLLREHGEFILPLPCIMPLKRWGFRSRFPVTLAAALFRALVRRVDGGVVEAGFRPGKWAEREAELLRGLVPHGVLFWQDAILTDPVAFAGKLKSHLRESIMEGTEVFNVSPYGDFFRVTAEGPQGRITRCCRAFVNTTGPWLSSLSRDIAAVPTPLWCKAFNVILKKQYEPEYGIGFHGNGRLYFLVPRGTASVLGTEYIAFSGDPEKVQVEERELAEFLDSFNVACPNASLSLSDVERVETGVLPMKRLKGGYPQLYGMERIYSDDGWIEVLSTKYTTFASQAVKVLDSASIRLGLPTSLMAGHSVST